MLKLVVIVTVYYFNSLKSISNILNNGSTEILLDYLSSAYREMVLQCKQTLQDSHISS